MQGLVDFATEIGDGIDVLLPAFCYLAACACFLFFVWSLWTLSSPHRHHHQYWQRPCWGGRPPTASAVPDCRM